MRKGRRRARLGVILQEPDELVLVVELGLKCSRTGLACFPEAIV